MALSTSWGLVAAIISMVCNGSFSSLNKLKRVERCHIDPQIFNLYFIFGVIISSLLVYFGLLFTDQVIEFTYLGVISGFCLSVCGVTTFAAIKYIGLAIGVTIWSGTAIFVSFIEGFMAGTKADNLPIAIVGCIILVCGVIGAGFSDKIAQRFCSQRAQQQDDTQITKLLGSESMGAAQQQNENEAGYANIDTDDDSDNSGSLLLGVLFAVLTGIFGGSIGFPSNWTSAKDNNDKLKYLISFAVGCCCVIPITSIYVLVAKKNGKHIDWYPRICVVPGLLAGVVWNIANIASLYAIESLTYGVAYPIMQSSLIVANLWAIFVWKEVTDKNVIALLFIFCVVVMGGCGLITIGVIGIK